MSDEKNRQILSSNLKYYMQRDGVSRKEMCISLGISYSTFSDWFNGKSYPRIDKIDLLASYFSITKSDLIEERER